MYITDYQDNDFIQCPVCGKKYLKSDNMFHINNNNKIYSYCNKCKNKKSIIQSYRSKYGILIDFDKMFNTYDIIQWYKWTNLEFTPNGKYLTNIPNELIKLDNIAILVRYVLEDILHWNNRECKLQLTQPIINKYKISFSKTEGIKNSPYKLLCLGYPELNFKEWEMIHATKNYWKSYSNFLEVVKSYYSNISLLSNELPLHNYFEDKFLLMSFNKLSRAKTIYYNKLSWQDILNDIGVKYVFPKTNKVTYNNKLLDSKDEVILYNFIHIDLNIKTLLNIGRKRNGKYVFLVNDIESKYNKFCPDFVIENIIINNINYKLDKPLIIEYYGFITDRKREDIINDYIIDYYKKIEYKNYYFHQREDIYFLDLYPQDLKNNFEGVRNKLTSFFMSNFNIDILKEAL